MTPTRTRTVYLLVLAVLAGAFLTACGDSKAKADSDPKQKESKFLGSYKNSKDNSSTLVLQTDHKGTLDMSGTKADVTWEVEGDDKIVVHAGIPISMFLNSDGSLRDEEGAVWKKT